MKKAPLIHIIALLLSLLTAEAHALDYDVDWPTSDKTSHTLAITINGCETRFRILNKDFETFSKSDKALTEALERAMQRYNGGCKN